MQKNRKPSADNRIGDTARATIERRIAKEKSRLVTQLKKNPSFHLACQKVGIGRRTYYHWRQEDKQFALDTESAIRDAIALRNDFVESKLLLGLK